MTLVEIDDGFDFRVLVVDGDLRRRARLYHRLAPFFSVHYGVFTQRPEYAERALRDAAKPL